MADPAFCLCDVSLDDARIEREQAIAVHDLLEDNMFVPVGHAGGPYRLRIALAEGRLALHIATDREAYDVSHYLSLTPFRPLLKDYTRMCESYYDAIRRPGPERLQALDMGRRGIHDEGSELLRERLVSKITIDKHTARRLFTLLYVLLVRNASSRILSS
ncbi:UPF0262 family protein [Phyllobacterium zundukense]|uniref:UPF0262 family protein n=1 Tax=Phyllobacterium zundukense TaxID=1867719 RepID=A0ACD4CVN3_9HYPH|nr:UPF0262 family protein [Phyllobacterium zundukense]UXN57657.1 UPF0262 family protein [Phyllobacterium zundukense]